MKDLVKKKDKELHDILSEKREELRGHRFGTAGSATRNVRAQRSVRHDVARILTEINARRKTA